jgi:hypothetical protein
VNDGELGRAVEGHAWESIPEEEKGEGKFHRKASPWSWRDDLTPEQVEEGSKVEEVEIAGIAGSVNLAPS